MSEEEKEKADDVVEQKVETPATEKKTEEEGAAEKSEPKEGEEGKAPVVADDGNKDGETSTDAENKEGAGEEPKEGAEVEQEEVEEVEEILEPMEDPGPAPEPVSIPLTGASRDIYGCPDGGDVNPENPMRMIPVSVIKEDMKMRAGVSDFMPFKDQVGKFKGEEILVVLDDDFTYGNNFFTFLNDATQEQYIKTVMYAKYLVAVEKKAERDKQKAREQAGLGSDDESEEEEEEEEEKIARPPEWISLGSESEVMDNMCEPTRPPMKFVISRRRRYFGAPIAFGDGSKEVVNEDGESQTFAEFPSVAVVDKDDPNIDDEEKAKEPLHRIQTDRGVQAVIVTSDTAAQTTRPLPRHVSLLCDIGTRPADIIPLDLDSVELKPKHKTKPTSATASTTTSTGTETETTPPSTGTETTTITTSTSTGTEITSTSPSTGSMETEPSTEKPTEKPQTADAKTPSKPASAKSKSETKTKTEAVDEGIVQDQDGDDTAEKLNSFLSTVCPRIHSALVENELLLLFDDEFGQLNKQDAGRMNVGTTDTKLEEHQSYKYVDCDYTHSVSCAAWHPFFPDIVAVACVRRLGATARSKLSMAASKSIVAVWNIHNPIEPQLLLQAPDEVYSLAFSDSEQYLLAGGCVNGQVLLWDFTSQFETLEFQQQKTRDQTTEVGAEPKTIQSLFCVAASAIEHGHRASVSELVWLPTDTEISRNGSIVPATQGQAPRSFQVMSVASDSSCLVWDIRHGVEKDGVYSRGALPALDLKWTPLLRIFLSNEKGMDSGGRKVAIRKPTRLSIEEVDEDLRTFMYVGTEGGNLLRLDWRAPESDSGKIGVQKIEHAVNAHAGPVKSLRRSPYIPGLLLSVGGMNICLWHESTQRGPLLTFKTNGVRATAGEWSLDRPGVFYVGKSDGTVEVWDLMDTTYGPSVVDAVCSPLPVTFLEPKDNSDSEHSFIAAGDDEGSLHVMMIPFGLCEQVPDESNRLNGFIQEELRRLEYVSSRFEARAIANSAVSNDDDTDDAASSAVGEGIEQQLKQYETMENDFLVEMGLRSADPIAEVEE